MNGAFISKIQGTNKAAFVMEEGNGSSTTYFSDFANLFISPNYFLFPIAGGSYVDTSGKCGPFFLYFDLDFATHRPEIGCRLSYCG